MWEDGTYDSLSISVVAKTQDQRLRKISSQVAEVFQRQYRYPGPFFGGENAWRLTESKDVIPNVVNQVPRNRKPEKWSYSHLKLMIVSIWSCEIFPIL